MNTHNSPNITVAVAVSGGVDSLCALVMLRNAGCQVLALHGLFLPDAPATAPAGLAEACAALEVPLHVADLRAEFEREVLAPFAAAYARGRTPNPCAYCNRAIKFGVLLDTALNLGAHSWPRATTPALLPHQMRPPLPLRKRCPCWPPPPMPPRIKVIFSALCRASDWAAPCFRCTDKPRSRRAP